MIVAIIQARMRSTRLPGKVLMEVNGEPLLKIMIKRVMSARKLDKVVVATSDLPADDAIANFCSVNMIDCFRGSEKDVLSRYYKCASDMGAKIIVRLTADCPLIDPKVIDLVVELYEKTEVDYAANTVPTETSMFPDGTDVEVFSYKALELAHNQATDLSDREHVTFFFWRSHTHLFKTEQLLNTENWSKFRITVDYPEDFIVVQKIITNLFKDENSPSLAEIVEFLKNNPELVALNKKYYFGQGWK